MGVGGGVFVDVFKRIYTKTSINSHILKLPMAIRWFVFFFKLCTLIQLTFKNRNHLPAIILSPITVIFEHLSESVFIHVLKKVKSGRTASGQAFGNTVTADSSNCASKPKHHSAKNSSIVRLCSFGKMMPLLGKCAN